MNATKEKYGLEKAKSLLKNVHKIYSARGKKVTCVDLKKESVDDATLAKLLIGPSGNLRAPTLKIGKNLMVGFHEETYADLMS